MKVGLDYRYLLVHNTRFNTSSGASTRAGDFNDHSILLTFRYQVAHRPVLPRLSSRQPRLHHLRQQKSTAHPCRVGGASSRVRGRSEELRALSTLTEIQREPARAKRYFSVSSPSLFTIIFTVLPFFFAVPVYSGWAALGVDEPEAEVEDSRFSSILL
jgi:hypothetical protein